jgi:hypothetical protein
MTIAIDADKTAGAELNSAAGITLDHRCVKKQERLAISCSRGNSGRGTSLSNPAA